MNPHKKQKLSFNSLTITLLSLIIFFKSDLIFAQVDEDISNTGKLKVIVSGFENDSGKCRFALDNTKLVYERDDTVWIGKVLPIVNKQVAVVIDSLEFGEYAVRVFHDENENEKVDTNFLGIPTEDYGYSNNASGWFGPPSWEKAKFIFDKPEMTIEIEVD
jgi:uncharacterized protein (DUF2141 family)